MKQTRIIMGMPITIEIVDKGAAKHFSAVFDYFRSVDERYSPYKEDSELSRINRGLPQSKWSPEMKAVLELCEQTSRQTKGYFNVKRGGQLDPSGLVKGWAIAGAANILLASGVDNFCIEAGGDIQAHGSNAQYRPWRVGIRNPFNDTEIIKAINVSSEGVATSGTYARGEHIYDPFQPDQPLERVRSLTVIGPNIYEADRYATAAFAMGEKGVAFIESTPGLEGYMVTDDKQATYTSGFVRYVASA